MDGRTHSCLLRKERQTALFIGQQSILCRDPRGVHNNGKWRRPKLILDSPRERIRLFKVSDTASRFGVYHISPYMLRGKMICKTVIPPLCCEAGRVQPPHTSQLFLRTGSAPSSPLLPKSLRKTVLILFLLVLDNEFLALHLKHSYLKWRPGSKRHCSKWNYVELY